MYINGIYAGVYFSYICLFVFIATIIYLAVAEYIENRLRKEQEKYEREIKIIQAVIGEVMNNACK